MTLEDTPKEAKLHGLAVSFSLRLSESSFLHFTLTLPKRGFGYFSSPQPRGKSNARYRGRFAYPSTEHVNYSKKPLQTARAGF